jgi:hypothetical protein
MRPAAQTRRHGRAKVSYFGMDFCMKRAFEHFAATQLTPSPVVVRVSEVDRDAERRWDGEGGGRAGRESQKRRQAAGRPPRKDARKP